MNEIEGGNSKLKLRYSPKIVEGTGFHTHKSSNKKDINITSTDFQKKKTKYIHK